MTDRRDIYRAIMIAAANGRGLHLTADEVFDLSLDDAIETCASNTVSESDWERFDNSNKTDFWRNQKPTVQANPANLAGWHRDDPNRPK